MLITRSRLTTDLQALVLVWGGERLWRTFSDIDTGAGALPYEHVLNKEPYVEHIARSALAAGVGRSEPSEPEFALLEGFQKQSSRSSGLAVSLHLKSLAISSASNVLL